MKNIILALSCAFALCFAGNAFADDALTDVVSAFSDGADCAGSLNGCYKEGRGDAGKTKEACKSLRKCKKECRSKRKTDKKDCKGKKGKAKRECKKAAGNNCIKACKSHKTKACKAARKGILKGLKNCKKKADNKACKNTAGRLWSAVKELLD